MTKKYDTHSVGKDWKRQRYGGIPKPKSNNKNLVYRNTAVRCAEVHSLPLNFPLKKAGYGLQAHGGFETEPFNLLFAFGDGTSKL